MEGCHICDGHTHKHAQLNFIVDIFIIHFKLVDYFGKRTRGIQIICNFLGVKFIKKRRLLEFNVSTVLRIF